ncbi:MAG: FAD-dependent oxidoreductase, partial [Dongiaceae bacterium]
LPRKIEEGRLDEIRECIGCNICVSGQHTSLPMRCTQNPTMGEEWRRNWHPEHIPPKGSDGSMLVVGAGPAGLEAARALGQRGYKVALAEATTELGGRVSWESSLPGLSAWARVRDWRVGRIRSMTNVEVYLDSRLTPENVLEFEFKHVMIATGAEWRRDGLGVSNTAPIPRADGAAIFAPRDVAAGVDMSGPVVVFDDDNFYMGGVIAEKLRRDGHDVTLVTTDASVSSWTVNTEEQHRIQAQLIELGVDIVTSHNLLSIGKNAVDIGCVYSGRARAIDAAAIVMVTSRQPRDELYQALAADQERLAGAGIRSLQKIGDADVPGIIALAVQDGHRAARELDNPPENPDMPFLREEIALPASV